MDLKAIEAELEEHLAQFSSMQDFDDPQQVSTPLDPNQLPISFVSQEGSEEHSVFVEEEVSLDLAVIKFKFNYSQNWRHYRFISYSTALL